MIVLFVMLCFLSGDLAGQCLHTKKAPALPSFATVEQCEKAVRQVLGADDQMKTRIGDIEYQWKCQTES